MGHVLVGQAMPGSPEDLAASQAAMMQDLANQGYSPGWGYGGGGYDPGAYYGYGAPQQPYDPSQYYGGAYGAPAQPYYDPSQQYGAAPAAGPSPSAYFDSATGLVFDPTTGQYYDPTTGMPVGAQQPAGPQRGNLQPGDPGVTNRTTAASRRRAAVLARQKQRGSRGVVSGLFSRVTSLFR